jgi:hypothetical protein
MGYLVYGPQLDAYAFDDRVLAHLRVVIVMKLRRQEPFTFSWTLPPGGGRVSLWLAPSIPIEFRFAERREPALNRAWLDSLASVAAGPSGLVLLPEPDDRRGGPPVVW